MKLRPRAVLKWTGAGLCAGVIVMWVAGPMVWRFFNPILPLAILTAWLFYRDRRNVRWAETGRCVGCGYDLSGLPAGAGCPECGKGAA